MANEEQILAPLLSAHRYDDAGQNGRNEYVTEAAIGVDGLQPTVCFQSPQGTGEPLPRDHVKD